MNFAMGAGSLGKACCGGLRVSVRRSWRIGRVTYPRSSQETPWPRIPVVRSQVAASIDALLVADSEV